jgi:hypothetical protein
MELKDPQEYLVKMAYTESTENTVHLDPKDQWAGLETKAKLVRKDPKDQLE